jgi:hypothetical protein
MPGPDDEFDPALNGGFSGNGEEDESGYDDMPVECGWEDESEGEDDGEDC